MQKIKVVWICHLSSVNVRKHLLLKKFSLLNVLRRIIGKKSLEYQDLGLWNELGAIEFEKIKDIELHIITPHLGLKKNIQTFCQNGVSYHCFDQERGVLSKIRNKILAPTNRYKRNRYFVKRIINDIQPDIINSIGVECPFMSLNSLDIDTNKYIFMLTMQTALSDPDFFSNYPMDKKTYQDNVLIEQMALKRAHYIGHDSYWYRKIASIYNPQAPKVRFRFCTKTDYSYINKNVKKEFDFVYYAANIIKAGDDAIKAFGIAHEKCNKITLNIIGAYSDEYKTHLDKLLKSYGIENAVTFSGFYENHDEALQQVVKSKFALVPIKVDIISSTVFESMALGLPVVTFITHGTPAVNRKSPTILLSKIDDHIDMANNMIKLVNNPKLAEILKNNAFNYVKEILDNERCMRVLADTYHAIYDNHYKGTELPDYITECIF